MSEETIQERFVADVQKKYKNTPEVTVHQLVQNSLILIVAEIRFYTKQKMVEYQNTLPANEVAKAFAEAQPQMLDEIAERTRKLLLSVVDEETYDKNNFEELMQWFRKN